MRGWRVEESGRVNVRVRDRKERGRSDTSEGGEGDGKEGTSVKVREQRWKGRERRG